jgi:hypothetical protein
VSHESEFPVGILEVNCELLSARQVWKELGGEKTLVPR